MNNDISIGIVENGWIIRFNKVIAPHIYDTHVARSHEELLEIVARMAKELRETRKPT